MEEGQWCSQGGLAVWLKFESFLSMTMIDIENPIRIPRIHQIRPCFSALICPLWEPNKD